MLIRTIVASMLFCGGALSTGACAQALDGAGNADGIVQEVKVEPRDAETLFRSGRSLTLLELTRLTSHLNGEEFLLAPVPDGATLAGLGVGVGMSTGQTVDTRLRPGLWWFPNGAIIDLGDGAPIVLAPRSVVAAGEPSMDTDVYWQAVSNGSVTCEDGYYACCGKNQHGQWRAKCIPDGQEPPGGADYPTSCTHGGEGASQCSNGSSMVPVEIGGPIGGPR